MAFKMICGVLRSNAKKITTGLWACQSVARPLPFEAGGVLRSNAKKITTGLWACQSVARHLPFEPPKLQTPPLLNPSVIGFKLGLYWGPSWDHKKELGVERKDGKGKEPGFRLHGLWLDWERGTYKKSEAVVPPTTELMKDMKDAPTVQLLEDMNTIWYQELWEEEWRKHGSKSGMEFLEYYRSATELGKHYIPIFNHSLEDLPEGNQEVKKVTTLIEESVTGDSKTIIPRVWFSNEEFKDGPHLLKQVKIRFNRDFEVIPYACTRDCESLKNFTFQKVG